MPTQFEQTDKPETEAAHDVFISYSTNDAEKAKRIVSVLEDAGIKCWIAERDIPPGATHWAASIEKAIRDSKAMVLVVSSHFNKSDQTPREIILGENQRILILPVRIEDFQPWGHLRYFLASLQWVDAAGDKLDERLSTITQVLNERIDPNSGWVPGIDESHLPKVDGYQSAKELGILPIPILALKMWHPDLNSDQPSQWLQAYNALVPLVGRDMEMSELLKLLNLDGFFRWCVFFGEAGMGKTRLAIEFCRQAMSSGWHAGFLHDEVLMSFVNADFICSWRPVVPTLIVVDYAASKVTDLKRLMARLASLEAEAKQAPPNAPKTPPVRMLLLERHADTEGWLKELFLAGEGQARDLIKEICLYRMHKLQPPSSASLENGEAIDSTLQIIENTFRQWEIIKGKKAPHIPAFSKKDWESIKFHTLNRPLYLQMAAIHACDTGSAAHLPSWGRGELLKSAVDRERKYVGGECISKIDLLPAVEHIASILCLAGGKAARSPQWRMVRDEELQRISVNVSGNEVERMRRAIFAEPDITGRETQTGLIQPDIISEGFAAQILQAKDEFVRTETLAQVIRLSGKDGWANLVRMVQDLSGLEDHLFESNNGDVESWLPPLLEGRSIDELRELIHVIPERSTALQPFGLQVNEHLLNTLPEDDLEARADCLLSLAALRSYYHRLSRHDVEQSIKELEKASSLFGEILLKNPDSPCLILMAKCYRLLDHNLHSLNKFEEAKQKSMIGALLATGSSIENCLATSTHSAQEIASLPIPDGQYEMLEYANCLNNYGINSKSVGDNEDALIVTKRAVKIGERLIDSGFHIYRADLARYLNNLSLAQHGCKDIEGAIINSRRSAEIRIELARDNPDEYGRPLSLTLSNLISYEYAQQNIEAAQEATKQLIGIYSDLAARDPSLYSAELAQSYHNIGYLCSDIAKTTEGIHYTLEGLKIREELLANDFDTYALALAWSNHNISSMYKDIDDYVSARPYAERAYELRLRWVQGGENRKVAELGSSAKSMADICQTLGDDKAEIIWLERVVEHNLNSDESNHAQGLAYHSLSEALGRLGRLQEAAEAAKQSAEILQKDYQNADPRTDLKGWMDAGCDYASALALQGDWGNDIIPLSESKAISRKVLDRIDSTEASKQFVYGALLNNFGHATFRLGELLNDSQQVDAGLKALQASLEHHLKTESMACAKETGRLAERAEQISARMHQSNNASYTQSDDFAKN